VTLIGDGITVENLAEWAGTIPYEILTNIGARVPRVYVTDDGPWTINDNPETTTDQGQ
jgi:hypothetical protein